jgi:hypothetical protein
MATRLIFGLHKVQHLLGDHKWILDLNQKIVCQNMPHLSQVNVLVYKVLPKFIYIYIYRHTHTYIYTYIGFVEIHQNYINNPMRVSKIHMVVTRWI